MSRAVLALLIDNDHCLGLAGSTRDAVSIEVEDVARVAGDACWNIGDGVSLALQTPWQDL